MRPNKCDRLSLLLHHQSTGCLLIKASAIATFETSSWLCNPRWVPPENNPYILAYLLYCCCFCLSGYFSKAWLVTNSHKKARSKGQQREFECVGYKDEVVKEIFSMFMREQLAAGVQIKDIKPEWSRMLGDESFEKEDVNGEALVYMFEGVVRGRMEKESVGQVSTRQARCAG